MTAVLYHIGLTVTDIARSRRFYEEAFGFIFDRELKLPAASIQPLMALDPPSGIHAVYLMLGSFTLELMKFDPPSREAAAARVFNQTGLAHISIAVDDVPATVERVLALGGSLAKSLGRAAVVRDPDGQMVELVASAVREETERGRAERVAARQ